VSSFRDKLKHAFAVEESGPIEPANDMQRDVIDRVCREVARRHLTTPSLAFIEMFKPTHYVGSQLLGRMVGWPIMKAIAREETQERYDEFITFLERRGSFDYICDRIEHFEAEYERLERERKAKQQADAQSGTDSDTEKKADHPAPDEENPQQ